MLRKIIMNSFQLLLMNSRVAEKNFITFERLCCISCTQQSLIEVSSSLHHNTAGLGRSIYILSEASYTYKNFIHLACDVYINCVCTGTHSLYISTRRLFSARELKFSLAQTRPQGWKKQRGET